MRQKMGLGEKLFSMPERVPFFSRLSLQVKFLLPIFVVFIFLGAGFGFQLTEALRVMVYDRVKITSAELVQRIALRTFLPEHFTTAFPENYAPLYARFAADVKNSEVRAVSLWDAGGRVLFSDNQNQIGKILPRSSQLDQAIGGQIVVDDAGSLTSAGSLIDIYVPLGVVAGQKPAGVAQIAYDLTSMTQYVQNLRLTVWGIITIVFAILFVFLFLFLKMFILRPLRRLHDMTRSFGGQTAVEDAGDEIASLTSSFTRMTGDLQNATESLEKKVRERTKALREATNALEKEKNVYEDSNRELTETKKAVLNILEDVQEAKEEINQEKNRLETILKSIGEGVYVVSKSNRVLLFNHQAEKLLGFAEAEVMDQSAEHVLKMYDEKGNLQSKEGISPIDEVWRSGRSDVIRNTNLARKDGTRFPAVLSAAPIMSKGAVVAGVVAFRDVTLEKEIDTMKSEFVSVASHQLRTPLSAIKWFLEMLVGGDAGPVNETQKEFLDRAYESNERMIKLVNDLLNVSRMESGKIKFEPKLTRIEEIFQSVSLELTPLARARNISITSAFADAKLPEVFVDADRMRQVIQNLISNAIKYTQGHGKVELSYERRPSELVFSVRDTGIGIPKDQQHKLFNKFFRADNVLKVQTDGSGLGLYISRAMVETSGGKMWFTSEENKGSTFSFSLPIYPHTK
ncbi:MAG TPA: ATP-binding protein [Patescibacteria group bacterium]|nr:ATP-binding protein [Patescibacteria group bacterium]